MKLKIAAVVISTLLISCAQPRTITKTEVVEVKVPVAVTPALPPELATSWVAPHVPTFVSPSDAKATSALTPDGERTLKELLLDLVSRVRMWEVWGGVTSGNPAKK